MGRPRLPAKLWEQEQPLGKRKRSTSQGGDHMNPHAIARSPQVHKAANRLCSGQGFLVQGCHLVVSEGSEGEGGLEEEGE